MSRREECLITDVLAALVHGANEKQRNSDGVRYSYTDKAVLGHLGQGGTTPTTALVCRPAYINLCASAFLFNETGVVKSHRGFS